MTAVRVPVSAVVLAGGRSSRFGRDKLAEPIDGRPLLQHAIDAIRPVAVEVVVVAAPDAMPRVPADVRVVHDPVAFEGPLAAARIGARAASEDVVLLVGGDMPEIVIAVVESMVDALDGFDAVVLEHDGRPRPLPMVVRRGPAVATASLLVGTGERRLGALADALATNVIPEGAWRPLDPDARTLRDIDTEADLG